MNFINQQIIDKNDSIIQQIKRIEINKEEISKYKQDLYNMQKQLDFFHYSLTSLKSEHVPDMSSHQFNAIKNTEKLKDDKKRNVLIKARFDRYRKAISFDTRLVALENKIQAAWRRDEIWAGIRDWGFLSGKIIF
jgi:translation elongation factor EF-4